MQGTFSLPLFLFVSAANSRLDVVNDQGPIPLPNVAMNVLKKVIFTSPSLSLGSHLWFLM
jgi:hypothetical protein